MTEEEIIKVAYAIFPEDFDYDGFKEDGTPTVKDVNEKRRNEWIEVELEKLENLKP
jgi:hypothetical protein